MKEAIVVAATGVLRRAGRAGSVFGPDVDLALSGGVRTAIRAVRARKAALQLEGPNHAVYRPIWLDAADELGATVEDRPGGYLAIRRDASSTLVWRNLVELDSFVVLQVASDKALVHELVRAAGLSVPDHVLCDTGDLRAMRRFLYSVGGPVVVKPAANTGRGNGLTCGVSTDADMARAALRASRFAPKLLVERQGTGRELRLLLLDGELIGAVERRPPHVVGDGRSCVAELVEAENERRLRSDGRQGMFPVVVDLDHMLALRDQRLTPRHIPRAGEEVRVKSMANAGGPQDNVTVAEDALPSPVVEACRMAASIVGLRLAAVEVVVSITGAGRSGGDVTILEVNGTPGLHYHYQVADEATKARVAVPILNTLLSGK